LAERRRGALLASIAGNSSIALADLEAHVGFPVPDDLVATREAVRHAAEAASRELAINQTILRRALEAGDAFLQQLFSSAAHVMPAHPPQPNDAVAPGTPPASTTGSASR
jgi:hypothetical protein